MKQTTNDEYPIETEGTKIAAKVRAEGNTWSKHTRNELLVKGMGIINQTSKSPPNRGVTKREFHSRQPQQNQEAHRFQKPMKKRIQTVAHLFHQREVTMQMPNSRIDPAKYRHIADFEADGQSINSVLEDIFERTNSRETHWESTPNNQPPNTKLHQTNNRSTSVGDVISINSKAYLCALTGWEPLSANVSTQFQEQITA